MTRFQSGTDSNLTICRGLAHACQPGLDGVERGAAVGVILMPFAKLNSAEMIRCNRYGSKGPISMDYDDSHLVVCRGPAADARQPGLNGVERGAAVGVVPAQRAVRLPDQRVDGADARRQRVDRVRRRQCRLLPTRQRRFSLRSLY